MTTLHKNKEDVIVMVIHACPVRPYEQKEGTVRKSNPKGCKPKKFDLHRATNQNLRAMKRR